VCGVTGVNGDQGASVYTILDGGVALVKITFPFSTEIFMGGGLFFLIFEKVDLLSEV
jgi:hypothetical protein